MDESEIIERAKLMTELNDDSKAALDLAFYLTFPSSPLVTYAVSSTSYHYSYMYDYHERS